MKRSYLFAGAITVAALAWVGSGALDVAGPPPGPPGPAAPDPPVATAASADSDEAPVAVQVRDLTARPHARTLTRFGRTEAERRVDVSVETTGRIAQLLVAKGDRVKAGSPLVRIAMDDRQDQLAQARATLTYREVAYQASLKLRQDGFRARVTIAEDAALLAQARADLAAIEMDIARTEVSAPFDGIVDDLPVEVGDLVQNNGMEGNSVVATVVDLDPLTIVCEVTERERPFVAAGAPAEVRLVTGDSVAGRVRFVASTAREATRTFRVELDVPNPEGRIAEGLTAEVRLRLGEVVAHLISPAVLTLDDAGRVGVKIVDADSRVAFVPVQIVDDTAAGMWLGGLPEKVRMITVGQEFVRAGERVRAVPELIRPAGPTPAATATPEAS